MPRHNIFDMAFSKVYPMLVQKAERKASRPCIKNPVQREAKLDFYFAKLFGLQYFF